MTGAPARSRSGLRRAGGFAVGILLIAAAVYAVWHTRGTVQNAMGSVRAAPAWAIGALIAIPALSWITTSCALWALTRRHGIVGVGEMTALVGSAWLLNYLPLKPGLVGRLAYHKRVNRIPVRASVRVLIDAVILTGASAVVILGLALGAKALHLHALGVSAVVIAPGVALAILAFAWRNGSWWIIAAVFKYADMLVWVARYALVFWMLDLPIGLAETVVIASVSQLAITIPVAGNGLGVREWAVGGVAGLAGAGLEPALAADLLNRAAELLVAVPVGLICSRLVVVRYARRAAAHSGRNAPDSADDRAESADMNHTPSPPVQG